MELTLDGFVHITYLSLLILFTYLLLTVVFPPYYFPNSIPTIPFYVSFLGSYTSMDQQDIYDKYLKDKLDKYGCVKIYFASRWNILITKPNYLNQVLKDESTFVKSGNHKKIPYSVLSKYTGDNIISSHGELWKLYRSIITHGVQFPEKSCVGVNCTKFIKLLNYNLKNGNTLQIGDLLQRFTLANITESMLGCQFGLLEIDSISELHTRLKHVKSQIFKPLYLNFPILDMIPSRIKAKREVMEFREYFTREVLQQQLNNVDDYTSVGYSLSKALNNGDLTMEQFTDNAMIIMIAGHENPQLFLTSLIYILAKNQELQEMLRNELSLDTKLEDSRLLNSIIFETLRLLPPLGQIINRKTSKNVVLGSYITIPRGVYVGYNNFITGRDETSWGVNANEFDINRWGSTNEQVLHNYKKWKSLGMMSAFHGGKRACLGERFALFESRMFLKSIVNCYKLSLDPNWKDRITPAGPICPFMLSCKFERV